MKKFFRNNSLSLVLMTLFTASMAGQYINGFKSYNDERIHEHLSLLSHSDYLFSGHFISSVFENMESEFLQMALFVILTIFLFQKGSSESKKLPEDRTKEELEEEKKEDDYYKRKVKRHPVLFRLYSCSLPIALLALFLISFLLHGYGSMKSINVDKIAHHESLISYWQVFKENKFWFESFQNWQSEFFSIAVLGIFSIFLRQIHSPQSKQIRDSDSSTGGSE